MELITGDAVFSGGGGVSTVWPDGGLTNLTLPTAAAAAGAASRQVAVAAIVASLMAAIALLGLAGNSLVVLVTFMDHDLKEHVSNIIIGNLALADLNTCLLVVLPAAGSLLADRWPFGQLLCRLHCGFNYLFIIVSMMSLALVSLDRKSAVEEPLQYLQRSRPSRLVSPLLLIWTTGALFAVVPIALDWVHYDYWEGVCAIGWFEHRGTVVYVIVAFCVCFLLPASLIVWSSHVIVSTSHRVSHRHGGSRKMDDASSLFSQSGRLSVRRLYNSVRSRGARAVRLVRRPPRARVVSASLHPTSPDVSGAALCRSRSGPRRSLRLDVAELVSGPHNIEGMLSEFGGQRRRRSQRSPGGGGAAERELTDQESEVPTVHIPAEVRRCSTLRPVIDTLRAWRPAASSELDQEVTTEGTTAGGGSSSSSSSSSSSNSSSGSGNTSGGTIHADPPSGVDSAVATDGAPRDRAKIILRRQGSYVVESVPQELPRLAVKITESQAAGSGASGGGRIAEPGGQLPPVSLADGAHQSQAPQQPLEAHRSRPLTTEQKRYLVRSHRRIIRSISIVVAIFFVCMTPFCVTKLVKIIFLREDLVPGWLNLLASVVQFLSSATNPFIYGFFRPDFKRAFTRIYRKVKVSLVISRR